MYFCGMNNRIVSLFKNGTQDIFSVFFTAGFPNLEDTTLVIKELEKNGAHLIEIGMPYSDPVADGATIQMSNQVALANGITIEKILQQLKEIRKEVSIPLILMGYLNPVMQYGIEKFCKEISEIGIDGVILPDLPIDLYLLQYKDLFEKYNISNVLLVTPQTSEERIRLIDDSTKGFIYLVSSNAITGNTAEISENQVDYFNRIKSYNLKNPTLIGFGINNNSTFQNACNHSRGAIIGSETIRSLEGATSAEVPERLADFSKKILG